LPVVGGRVAPSGHLPQATVEWRGAGGGGGQGGSKLIPQRESGDGRCSAEGSGGRRRGSRARRCETGGRRTEAAAWVRAAELAASAALCGHPLSTWEGSHCHCRRRPRQPPPPRPPPFKLIASGRNPPPTIRLRRGRKCCHWQALTGVTAAGAVKHLPRQALSSTSSHRGRRGSFSEFCPIIGAASKSPAVRRGPPGHDRRDVSPRKEGCWLESFAIYCREARYGPGPPEPLKTLTACK
jgi:hypothetical protein